MCPNESMGPFGSQDQNSFLLGNAGPDYHQEGLAEENNKRLAHKTPILSSSERHESLTQFIGELLVNLYIYIFSLRQSYKVSVTWVSCSSDAVSIHTHALYHKLLHLELIFGLIYYPWIHFHVGHTAWAKAVSCRNAFFDQLFACHLFVFVRRKMMQPLQKISLKRNSTLLDPVWSVSYNPALNYLKWVWQIYMIFYLLILLLVLSF